MSGAIYWFVGERVVSKIENWISIHPEPLWITFEIIICFSSSYFEFPYFVLSKPNIIITFRPICQDFRIISNIFIWNRAILWLFFVSWNIWKMLEIRRQKPQPPLFPFRFINTKLSYQTFCNCSRLFMLIWWFWCYYQTPNTKCVSINSYFGFSNTLHCVAFIFTLFLRFCFFEITIINHWIYILSILGWFGCFACCGLTLWFWFRLHLWKSNQTKVVELNILSLLLSG